MKEMIKTDIKKIIALLLSVSMILSMNMSVFAEEVNGEVNDSAVEETTQAEEIAEEDSDDKTEDNAQVEEVAETKESAGVVDADELLQTGGSDDYIEVSAKIGEFLFYYYEVDEDVMFKFYKQEAHYADIKTKPLKSSIESVQSLTIDPSRTNSLAKRVEFSNNNDWSCLQYFTGLTSLTINGVNDITSIVFPSSLTSLTINNCQFNCMLDLSGCTNLTNLTFTGNTKVAEAANGADFTIEGLNYHKVFINGGDVETGSSTLRSLQTARFDRSDLKYIYLPENVNGSGELVFTSVNCTQLIDVNTGGYKLINGFNGNTQYAPSFKGCTSLQSLNIKGKTDRESQSLNIECCSRLEKPTIYYFFNNASDVVDVNASGINLKNGDANFGRLEGSPLGKYKLSGFEDTYLTRYVNNLDDSTLFVESEAKSSKTAFVVPKQDYDKFVKEQLWGSGKDSKRRDYSANPIVLRVQQCAQQNSDGNIVCVARPDVIEDNTPYFFTKDGIPLPDCEYEYSVTVEKKPTDEELTKAGFTTDDAKNGYQVIDVTRTDRRLSVTACNPGKAILKISAKDGSDKDIEQHIIVMNPVVSATIDEVDEGGNSNLFTSSGDHSFSATFETKYPSLIDYSEGNVWWKLYKKSSEGKLEYENATDDGLKIYCNASSKSIGADKKIHETFKLEVEKTAVGGELAIGGEVGANVDSSGKIINVPNDYEFVIANMGTNLHSASKDSARPKDFYLAYQASQADEGCINNSTTRSLSQIDFNMPVFINTSNYRVVAPYVVDTDGTKYSDYLELKADAEKPGKYRLQFRADKTPEQIGRFLRDLNDETRKVTVKSAIEKKNDGGKYETLKEFSETINFVGRFTITYDLSGGLISGNKSSGEYYIPESKSDAYNDKFILDNENKPTKRGYTFTEWDYNGNKFNGITSDMVGNITVKAKWKANEYTNTLIYDANGGEGAPANQEDKVTFPNTKSSLSFDQNYPTRSPSGNCSYVFAGWYTEKTDPVDPKLGTVKDPKLIGGPQEAVEVGDNDVADDQVRKVYARWEYAKPKVTKASISFTDNGMIGLNFIIINLGSYIGKAYISINGEKGKEIGDYANDKGEHFFTAEINAKNIRDDVVVHIYRKDEDDNVVTIPIMYSSGEDDNDPYSGLENDDPDYPDSYGKFVYSIPKYVEAARNGNYSNELYYLLDALLKYGDCASCYFNYNYKEPTIPVVAEPLKEGDNGYKDYGYYNYAAKIPTFPEGVTYVGSSLILESEIKVRHYFRMEDEEKISVKVDSDEATIHSKDGLCYIEYTTSYHNLGTNKTISISDGKTTSTMYYCPLSYCEKVNRESGDEKLKALANSLYWLSYYSGKYNWLK